MKRNEPKPKLLENFKMSLFLSVREKEKESFECIYSVQGKRERALVVTKSVICCCFIVDCEIC